MLLGGSPELAGTGTKKRGTRKGKERSMLKAEPFPDLQCPADTTRTDTQTHTHTGPHHLPQETPQQLQTLHKTQK